MELLIKKCVYDEQVTKVCTIQTIDASDLGKKAEQNTKIAEIKKKMIIIPDHDNYSSTPDCNKLTKENFSKTLKQ